MHHVPAGSLPVSRAAKLLVSITHRPSASLPIGHVELKGEEAIDDVILIPPPATPPVVPPVPFSTSFSPVESGAVLRSKPLPSLGYHVLVCDDESVNRRLHERMLHRLGCTSVCTADGDEVEPALRAAEEAGKPVQLILLDIIMPRVPGDEALRRLRLAGINTPAIAATGNVYSGRSEYYMRLGFDGVLKKSFSLSQLADAMTEVMKKHEASSSSSAISSTTARIA